MQPRPMAPTSTPEWPSVRVGIAPGELMRSELRRPARPRTSRPTMRPPLTDEQHLRVLRQRPEVVGDDALELVGDLADLCHLLELVVAGVNRQIETFDAVRVLVRLLELADLPDERVDQWLELLAE